MSTKEYREAVSELLDILEHTDEKLVKKIPPELIVFWKQNKSEEYIPELDHNLSLDEMKLQTKTRQLIAMIYINYLCDTEKRKDIRKLLKESEVKENLNEIENQPIDVFIKPDKEELKQNDNVDLEDQRKIDEDIYMIEKETTSFFVYIIEKIKRLFRRIIY